MENVLLFWDIVDSPHLLCIILLALNLIVQLSVDIQKGFDSSEKKIDQLTLEKVDFIEEKIQNGFFKTRLYEQGSHLFEMQRQRKVHTIF